MHEQNKNAQNNFPPETYIDLHKHAFPDDDPAAPVLGITDDVIIAPNLTSLIEAPEVIVADVENEGRLVGYSLAIPIGRMDPSRAGESTDTAYIYYTAIEPESQGKGFVVPLNDVMISKLKQQGYSYVERDSMIANGYADKIAKNYQDSIVESYEHNNFPEIGPERFMRIKLGEVAINEPK